MRSVLVLCLAALFITGCAHDHSGNSGTSGDVELIGQGVVHLPGVDPTADRNFIWEYETEAWRDDRESVFHLMRTDIGFAFDPDSGEISNVSVKSSERGRAFRHVCLTPGPAGSGVLVIRMTTLLDDRDRDMTIVKVHSTDPSTHMCEEYGVGPKDGLVEGVHVIFDPDDGTFKVLPDTGAYLAGAGLGMERKMTIDADRVEVDTDVLP